MADDIESPIPGGVLKAAKVAIVSISFKQQLARPQLAEHGCGQIRFGQQGYSVLLVSGMKISAVSVQAGYSARK